MLATLLRVMGGALPRHRRAWARRLLRAGEAAARRLVVIGAAKVTLDGALPAAGPRTAGGKPRAPRRLSFRMIEPRQGPLPPEPVALSLPFADPGEAVGPGRLAERADAMGALLSDLPRAARRYALRMARADLAPPGPRRCGAMRPGLPPGWRPRSAHPVHEILGTFHRTALVAHEIEWEPG